MKTQEIIKKYGVDKAHLERVARISVLLFNKIIPFFSELNKYNNQKDLNLLKTAALLHDIGIKFECAYNMPHNKAGAEFIFNNKPDEIDEKDLPVLCCLIRYHRKSPPKEYHKFYKDLTFENKKKVNFLAPVIKLSDSFDTLHLGLVEDFSVYYSRGSNILTLSFAENIMLNKSFLKNIERKKDLFEAVYQTKIKVL